MYSHPRAKVAQLAEQRIRNAQVLGSIPSLGCKKKRLDTGRPSMLVYGMLRRFLSTRGVIPFVLCFQIVPLLVFPPSSYTIKSQEWWLPVLLTLLVIVSLFQLLVRKTRILWPWYLLSFAQGVNIISRLMMLLPHATMNKAGTQVFNGLYVVVSLAAMVFSAFEIWYSDLPEVRRNLLST
jgi:hypothetical protein